MEPIEVVEKSGWSKESKRLLGELGYSSEFVVRLQEYYNQKQTFNRDMTALLSGIQMEIRKGAVDAVYRLCESLITSCKLFLPQAAEFDSKFVEFMLTKIEDMLSTLVREEYSRNYLLALQKKYGDLINATKRN